VGRRLVRFLAWKGLLYLVVAVVLAGVTRDLMLSALLTLGFAVGDSSVAVLLRRPNRREEPAERTGTDAGPSPPATSQRADHSSMVPDAD
jgi:hypothetical protein